MRRCSWRNAAKISCVSMLGVVGCSGTTLAYAAAQGSDGLSAWLANSKITAQLRDYYFTEQYAHILPFKRANSLGGWINIHTPNYRGLSLDVGGYTAQSLGVNPSDPKQTVPSLPSSDLTVLGQAYVQYAGHGLTIRAGNQPLNTPFAQSNALDTRMIPPMFQGVGGRYKTPVPGLSLYGYRIYRFKGWASTDFTNTDTGKSATNLIAKIPQVKSNGFVTYGVRDHYRNLRSQVWYYDFYNRLRLGYGEVKAHVGLERGPLKALLFGAQVAREWNTGHQTLPYQHVDSNLYGARVGIVVPHDVALLSYNAVTRHDGAFRGGGFVSPYQLGAYDTSTIYTDVFGVSLGSSVASPGQAWSLKDIWKLPQQHLILIGDYTHLNAPSRFIGANGTLPGVGAHAHTEEFIGKYNFAKNWQAKLLYARINTNSKLGAIQVGRFYLTYSFGRV